MGSGISTIFLAAYVAHHGASLLSLEHDPAYYEGTSQLLERFRLRDRVDLRLALLAPRLCLDGRVYQFYNTALDGSFDFVLVDGPPGSLGRQATFFAAHEHLAPEWELWLDDGNRDHEKACVRLWRSHFRFDATLHELPDSPGFLDRGHWRLRPAESPESSTTGRTTDRTR